MVTLGILGLLGGIALGAYGCMQLQESNASVKKIVNSDMMSHLLYQGKKDRAEDQKEIAAEKEAKELAELDEKLQKLEQMKAEKAAEETAQTEETQEK